MSVERFPEPHRTPEPKNVAEPFGTLVRSWSEMAAHGLGLGSGNLREPSAARWFPVPLPLKEGTGTRARFVAVSR
jgi:hypothetical protein